MSEANKSTTNQQQIYDLIIVGAGPAGLTASIYASRYKLSNLVIGKVLGGELSFAHRVCNYPGFMSISGIELGEKWKEQVESLGGKILLKEAGKIEILQSSLRSGTKFESVFESRAKKFERSPSASGRDAVNAKTLSNLSPRRELFKIYVGKDEVYQSKALIVATGSERRRLNIPGEKEYVGKGVSYCYTCDAPFFKDKTVALVGGSDSAVSGAIHTAEYAKKVYIIYRKDKLRAEPIWQEEWQRIEASGKGEAIYNTNITQILGGKEFAKLKAQSAKLKATTKNLKLEEKNQVVGVLLDNPYKCEKFLPVDGAFIEIGSVPGTTLVQPLGVELDETGHVIVNEEMETNIPGLFCAGDMVNKSAKFKQAVLAMAQGALAAASAYKFIKQESAPQIKGV